MDSVSSVSTWRALAPFDSMNPDLMLYLCLCISAESDPRGLHLPVHTCLFFVKYCLKYIYFDIHNRILLIL